MKKTNKILILALILVGSGVAYATYTATTAQPSSSTKTDVTTTYDENPTPGEVVPDVRDPDSPEDVPPPKNTEPVPKQVIPDKKVVDRQAIARSLVTQNSCEAENGIWTRSMALTEYYCVLPTTDAGKSCTGRSQCESWCQAPKDTSSGDSVVGTCAGYTSASCSQDVEDGIAEAQKCM